MIVLDASAGIDALLGHPVARGLVAEEPVHAPASIDLEVFHVLRRLESSGRLSRSQATHAASAWLALGISRHPPVSLAGRVWELRHTVTPYDAASVALAEELGCALVTSDGRLARAPGVRCPVTVLPSR